MTLELHAEHVIDLTFLQVGRGNSGVTGEHRTIARRMDVQDDVSTSLKPEQVVNHVDVRRKLTNGLRNSAAVRLESIT